MKKPHRQSLGSKTPNHTSVIQDVVDVTNLQLNLVLAEGGGKHAKNRFGDNKRKIIPQFHPLQDVVFINPRPNAVSKMD